MIKLIILIIISLSGKTLIKIVIKTTISDKCRTLDSLNGYNIFKQTIHMLYQVIKKAKTSHPVIPCIQNTRASSQKP